jgi:GAF domain-containing protein
MPFLRIQTGLSGLSKVVKVRLYVGLFSAILTNIKIYSGLPTGMAQKEISMTESTLRFLQQENIRLQEENKLLRQENSSLHSYLQAVEELSTATQRLDSIENPLALLDELLYKTMGIIGARDGSISRLDQTTGELEFILVHGEIWQELRGYRLKAKESIAGWVIDQRQPLIVNNPSQDWRFSLEVDQEFNFLTRSIICVPIMAQDELIGVIELLNKAGDQFNESDLAVLSTLSRVAAQLLVSAPA